jgi:hypothetical protein
MPSISGAKDAPNTIAIRCRQNHTELLLRTEGIWRTSRAGKVEVEYRIGGQSSVKSTWDASADGRVATYKDDAVGLLRSLPEDMPLTISVLDGAGQGHTATFRLAGLDAIRKKFAMACKWAPAADTASSEKR